MLGTDGRAVTPAKRVLRRGKEDDRTRFFFYFKHLVVDEFNTIKKLSRLDLPSGLSAFVAGRKVASIVLGERSRIS